MKIIDAIAGQPKALLLVELAIWLALVAWVDAITPYRFTMFVFYAAPIFIIAYRFDQNPGLLAAAGCDAIQWYANLATQPYGNDWQTTVWSLLTRLTALSFVAICGASISRFHEETRRRLQALEHAQKLEHEIVRVGDREQMRIGQDLHDGVCQSLAALDCATECLKVELEKSGLPQAATAHQIQKLLKETTIEARNLARGLVPVAVEPDGLVTSLRSLVTNTGALRHAAIDFESRGDVEIKDTDVASHLYRIAQEALSNAMRHANATHVTVSVIRDSAGLHISVADDGCGSAAQPRSDGMGWRTMRYRAKLIGANIKVDASSSGGTTVRCSLPMQALQPA